MTSVETNDVMSPVSNLDLTQDTNTVDTGTPNTVKASYPDVIQNLLMVSSDEKVMHEATLLNTVQASYFVLDPKVYHDELNLVYQNLHYTMPNTPDAAAFTALASQAFQHPQYAGQMTYHLYSTPYESDVVPFSPADVILPSPAVNQLASGRVPAPGQLIYPEATNIGSMDAEQTPLVPEEFEDGLESYLKQYVKINDAQEKINLRARIITDVVDGFLVFPKVTDPRSGEPRLLAVRNTEGKTALPVFTSSQYFDSWLSQETTSHAAVSTLEMFSDEVTDAVLNTLNYVLINPGSRYAVGLHREELQNKQSLLAAEVSNIASTPLKSEAPDASIKQTSVPTTTTPLHQLTLGAGVLLTDTAEKNLLEALAPYQSAINYVYTMMAKQDGSNTYQPTLVVSGNLTVDTERYNVFLSTMTTLLSEAMNTAFNVYAVPAELSNNYAAELDKLSDPIYASDSNVVVYDCSNQNVLDVMYNLMVNQDLGELYGRLLNSKIYTLIPSHTEMNGNDFPLMMLNMPNGEQVHPIFTNREAIRSYMENPLEQGQGIYLYSFSDACHAANIQNVDSIFINPAGPALHEVKRVEFESLAQGLLPGSKTIIERESSPENTLPTPTETAVEQPIETPVDTVAPITENTVSEVTPQPEVAPTESPLVSLLRQVAAHPNLNSKEGLSTIKGAYEAVMTQLVVVPMEKDSLPTEFAPVAFSGDNNALGLVLFTDEFTCNAWRNGKENIGRIDKIPFNTLCQYAQQLNVSYLVVNHEQDTSLTIPADDFRFLALGQLPEILNHIEAAPATPPPTAVEPAPVTPPKTSTTWENPMESLTEMSPLAETILETQTEQPVPLAQPAVQPTRPALAASTPVTADNFFLLDAINATVPSGFNTKLINQYSVYTNSEGTDKLDAVINMYQELLNGCLLIPIPDQPRAGDPLPLPTITDENNLPAALVFSIQSSLKDFCKEAFLPDDYALVPVSVIVDEAFKQGVQKLLLTMAENGQVFVITEGCMASLLAGDVPEAEALMEDYNISVSSNPLSKLSGLAKKIPGLNKSNEPKTPKSEKAVKPDAKKNIGALFGKVKDLLGKEL